MRCWPTIAGFGIILLCAETGCGPVGYLYTVTNKASRALAEAKTADAKRLAPYEYWSAVTYLHMAREKAGEADFQLAVAYGKRAVQMSKDATRVARARDRGSADDRAVEGVGAQTGPAKRRTEDASEEDADE